MVRKIRKLSQLASEHSGHHFQESPGSCSALFIHHEVFHFAVGVKLDDLRILPADVDDRFRVPGQEVHTLRMAGNLRDAVIPAVNVGSSISGCIDPHDLLFLNSRFLNRQIQTLLGAHHRTAAGRNDHGGFYFSILI